MGVILYINPKPSPNDRITKAAGETKHELSVVTSLDTAIQIIQVHPVDVVITKDFSGMWKILIDLVGLDIPLILVTENSSYEEVGFKTWRDTTSKKEMFDYLSSINNYVKPSELTSL